MDEEKIAYVRTAVVCLADARADESADSIFDIIDKLVGNFLTEEEAIVMKEDFQLNWDFVATAETHADTVSTIADYLCGYSCGTASEGIIEYLNRHEHQTIQEK